MLIQEFIDISLFFFATLFVACLLFGISFFTVQTTWYYEKVSIYECGFLPFKDARGHFPVQFILYAIVFLIFDLELSYLFPWSITYLYYSYVGINVMVFFIVILLYGFYYEWFNGLFEMGQK